MKKWSELSVKMFYSVPISMLKLKTASVQRSDRGLATEDTTPPPDKIDTLYDVPPRNRPSGIDTRTPYMMYLHVTDHLVSILGHPI